jgi:hypothetical protein
MAYTNPAAGSHASLQDVCAGGYVHGILEEVSLHQPDFKDHPGSMCANVPDNNAATCFHGVGHALMFFYKRDTQSALIACRTLGPRNEAPRCFEGVWMELFWGSTEHTGPNSLGWDFNKPFAPCAASAQDAKQACFLYSSFGYLRVHPMDYSGAITHCVTSDLVDSDAGFCLKGVGITMVRYLKAHDLERSESFAKGLTYDQKHSFYQGVLGYSHYSGVSTIELSSSCTRFTEDKAVCADVLAEIK